MERPRPSLHHIALTVTDLEASQRWYEDVFGIAFVGDIPHEGGLGRMLSDSNQQLNIVLHRHDSNERERFKETRTGLDHVGLFLSSRAELEEWQRHLEDNGVVRAEAADRPLTQSPIAGVPYGSILVFRDPDNIQLELYAPPEEGGAAP